jgi:hypothetical protein
MTGMKPVALWLEKAKREQKKRLQSISPTKSGRVRTEAGTENGMQGGRTEHLESLPDRLLVENLLARIWIGAVFDTLHVLLGEGGWLDVRVDAQQYFDWPGIWTRASCSIPRVDMRTQGAAEHREIQTVMIIPASRMGMNSEGMAGERGGRRESAAKKGQE